MTGWLINGATLLVMGVVARFIGKRGSRDVMWIVELGALLGGLACLFMAIRQL